MKNASHQAERLVGDDFAAVTLTKLRIQLTAVVLIALILAVTVTGYTFRRTATDALVDQASKHLQSVRTVKTEQLRKYFQTVQEQLQAFAANSKVVDAMTEFSDALAADLANRPPSPEQLGEIRTAIDTFYDRTFADEYVRRNGNGATKALNWLAAVEGDTAYLQNLYVTNGLTSSTAKAQGDQAKDSPRYGAAHAKYHPFMQRFLTDFGCCNILLCHPDTGNVIYSARKGPDFGTSLLHGPYARANVGRAFRQAMTATDPGEVFLVDFEPYTPCYEDVAGFMSTPLFSDGRKVGVAVFHLSVDRINRIVAQIDTYSETGETYVVGADRLFRTDSRFLDELAVATTIKNPNVVVDTVATRLALSGKTAYGIVVGYRGTPVLSCWSPFDFGSGEHDGKNRLGWAIVTEVGLNEIQGSFRATRAIRGSVLLWSLLAVGVLGFAMYMTRQISQSGAFHRSTPALPSARLAKTREDFAAGGKFTGICDEHDDYWDRALEYGRDSADRDSIQEHIQKIVGNIQHSTLEVSTSAGKIRAITENLSKECDAQSGQIGDTSIAIREMVDSIGEVAENTAKSAEVAEEGRQSATKGSRAVSNTIDGMERIRHQVQETAKRIKRLGESSQEIGEIVQLISDVADRTSILALNASIQAVMAGEAGQGFAVVAEEVERLAKRCNEATKQIARLVRCIQSETSGAIVGMEESIREVVEGSTLASQAGEALADIDSVSNRLAELISSISCAAKQQARGGLLVSRSIDEVSSVMHETADGAKRTASAVGRLADLADNLRVAVSRLGMPENSDPSPSFVPDARDPGTSAVDVPLFFSGEDDVASAAASAPTS